jgi:uncharacterized membrane protein YeaQ/YmgE (transglycosylase-associated protein family)
MTSTEIVHRLRVGFALVVGVLAGKFAAQTMQRHASEFFIGAFMLGVIVTHGCYWLFDRVRRPDSS